MHRFFRQQPIMLAVFAFVCMQPVTSANECQQLPINHNLYLFAWPALNVDYGCPFVNDAKFKKYIYSHSTKIYLHSRHYFTSSNCIFMQLLGIVSIQLQGNYILVNCQENKFIQRTHIYSQKVYPFEAGNCIRSRNYNHFKELISSFNEIISIQGNIFIQGKHIHSGKTFGGRTWAHPRTAARYRA